LFGVFGIGYVTLVPIEQITYRSHHRTYKVTIQQQQVLLPTCQQTQPIIQPAHNTTDTNNENRKLTHQQLVNAHKAVYPSGQALAWQDQ